MRILSALSIYLLWTLCGAQRSEVIQPYSFQTVRLGDTLDIKCHIYSKLRTRVWYKLTSSRRLQLLTSTDNFLCHTTVTDKRFFTMSSMLDNTLRIMNTTWEDAGTYYCGVVNLENVKFSSGTVVEIEGDSNPIQSVLQIPDHTTAQPGDSVTLSCSFTSSHCPQEHTSVMWLRSGPAPQIVSWNPGNATITCETEDNTREMSCVHNLTVSSAEDGTYLCVVTACGDTQFGSGSRIELKEIAPAHLNPTDMALIVVSVAYGVTVLVLVGVICKIFKKQTKEMDEQCQGSPQDNQFGDSVTYAGVNIRTWSAPYRATIGQNRQDAVVYSEVRNY